MIKDSSFWILAGRMYSLTLSNSIPGTSPLRDYAWLRSTWRDIRFSLVMLPICLSPVFVSYDPWCLLGGSEALRPTLAVLFSLVLFGLMYRMYKLLLKAEALRESLYIQAKRDSLTSLGNRLAFKEALHGEARRADLQGYPICLMLLDVDEMGALNERLGHGQGDALLKNLARVLRHHTRPDVDQAFRIGGDNFSLLLPGMAAQDAFRLMYRIKASFSRIAGLAGGAGEARCSAAVEPYTPQESPEVWFQRVESLLRVEQGRGARQGPHEHEGVGHPHR